MRYAGQDRALRLLVQQCKVLSDLKGFLWEREDLPKAPMKSLNHLISGGAFRPLDLKFWMSKQSGTRFSIVDKRRLAVKLGHGLMDFFDASIDSSNIYFAVSKGECILSNPPYLRFTSGIPTSAELREFRIGHPVLLSFAKLLLEIDYGEEIPLKISPSYGDENLLSWARLLEWAERMEDERSDSYLEAIRGCLNVHYNIAQSLRHSESAGKEADLKIREEIYVGVVEKLERASEQSIPSSSNKRRRREESPPGQEHIATKSSESSTASADIDQDLSSRLNTDLGRTSPRKRSRKSDLSEPIAIRGGNNNKFDMLKLQYKQTVECSSAGWFDDNTPATYGHDVYVHPCRQFDFSSLRIDPDLDADFVFNSCKYADDFLKKHQNTYELVFSEAIDEQPRIKVAILDTGIDIGHPYIIARKERIKDIWTWADGLGGREDGRAGDSSGHGTHIANLLLEMAPDSDVYIAQIAEFSPIEPGQIAKVRLPSDPAELHEY